MGGVAPPLPLRPSSIRLHLYGALALVVTTILTQLGGLMALGLACQICLFVLVGRVILLHTARRGRLVAMLEPVSRAAAGELHVHVPEGADDEAGHVAEAVNRLLDTVREQALAATVERDLDLALVRETPNGLLVTDAHGLVRRANPALARLLPVRGDPVGKRPIDTIPVADFQELIDEARDTGAVCERTLTHGKHDLLIRALPTEDGAGCLGVVLDITSIRSAERTRRDFVANVSHEIRTPITAIVGYAEALEGERERIPADAHFMLDAVKRNAVRLQLLIDDVLHLSRLESRHSDLELTREPLQPIIETVLERFTGVARQKSLQLSVNPTEAEALINPDGLEHALSNLVDNAVKYTAEGSVLIEVEVEGKHVLVRVADTGIGIDPVHHPRVFERFYRVDPGRARSVGGTGLGLALVKHLCSAMSAEIHFESQPGVGSRFTLRLPA
ncbi:MAG: histidine kinase [Myxococcales bacterium]|nr:histidine kinase [Myxococcales bacterium]